MDNQEHKGVASEYKTESTGGTLYIKGAEFDSGMEVEVVSMEKFTPEKADYGVKHVYGAGGKITKENWFVKNGILLEGESFKYTFKIGDDTREFDNSSLSFYFAFTKVDPLAGDKLKIKRTKESDTKVDWSIVKI